MKPFVDATVIVLAFTENTAKNKCRALLQGEFVTNALCLVEAQKAIAKISNDRVYASFSIKSMFKGRGVIVPLDKNLLFRSLKLVSSGLDAFDSVHYAAALLNDCSELISYDADFGNLGIIHTTP